MKTISDHILDILQNSVNAKATLIEIMVEENKKTDICSIKIIDNGCGMDQATLKQATDPFFTSRKTRKVGLGLSLFKQSAEMSGGNFTVNSVKGEGTEIEAQLRISNIDRPPLGDIWDTLYLTMLSYEKIIFSYRHKTENGDFYLKSSELREMLGEVSFQQKEIREAIIDLIKNNLKEINSLI